MQHIVNLLVFQSSEPRPLFELSPWIDCRFLMPIEAMLLTWEDVQLYEAAAEAKLSPGLIRWLDNGKLVSGDPKSLPDWAGDIGTRATNLSLR